MARKLWPVIFLVAVLSLSGCGGGGEEKQPPQGAPAAVETPFFEEEPIEAAPAPGGRVTRAGEAPRFEISVANLTTAGSQPSEGSYRMRQGAFDTGGRVGPGISGNGDELVFTSDAQLVSEDRNSFADVYIRDAATGRTLLVSRSTGLNAGNGPSLHADVSDDGRYVCFESSATDLVAGGTNGKFHVFLRDRLASPPVTLLVSKSSTGDQGNGDSRNCAISENGQFIAFESAADNLAGQADTNGKRDIFVHDQQAGTTERVSLTGAAAEADGDSAFPSISDDGRFVVFASRATNLVRGDTNGKWDIFVRDRQVGAIRRVTSFVAVVSGSPRSIESNGDSLRPVISANGQWVAFESDATNLEDGDTNGATDIFRAPARSSRRPTRVSVSSADAGGAVFEADKASRYPSISRDGRFVAFMTEGATLIEADSNALLDIYVHDAINVRTIRVSTSVEGAQADGASQFPGISADGRYVVFETLASNLLSPDANLGTSDVARVRNTLAQ